MKLLFITEFFPLDTKLRFTGGVETRTFYIIKNLAKKHSVLIICRKTAPFTGIRTPDVRKNVKVYCLGTKSSVIEANFLSLWGRLIFMLAAFLKGLTLDFDLVEGSNFTTYLPAFLIGFVKKKPVVSWWPDVLGKEWFKNFGLAGFFGWIIEKISLKLSWTKVIALSQKTKQKLIKAGINKNKVKVVYGGVEINRFKSLKVKKLKSPLIIISISRLVKYKRVKDLILAFSKLVMVNDNLNLTIVGQGPEKNNLKKLILKNRIEKKVKFYQNLSRSKLITLLKQSHILCLPSIIEGFGLATIEAAASGVPYIITDIEINREITQNGQGGLFYKKMDVNDLKEKILLLLKNKKLYQQKQQEGLRLAKIYDWQKIASQTEKVYQGALNE